MSGGARESADAALIAALVSGLTQEEAASAAGVSVATVRRRLGDREFRGELHDARREVVAGAVALLAGYATSAAETLAGLLKAESETVRLRAATGVLELVEELGNAVDVDARLEMLERAAGLRGLVAA